MNWAACSTRKTKTWPSKIAFVQSQQVGFLLEWGHASPSSGWEAVRYLCPEDHKHHLCQLVPLLKQTWTTFTCTVVDCLFLNKQAYPGSLYHRKMIDRATDGEACFMQGNYSLCSKFINWKLQDILGYDVYNAWCWKITQLVVRFRYTSS